MGTIRQRAEYITDKQINMVKNWQCFVSSMECSHLFWVFFYLGLMEERKREEKRNETLLAALVIINQQTGVCKGHEEIES